MDIYERVRAARLLAGLTFDELAARLGVQRVNPVRWESPTSQKRLPSRQVVPLAVATGFPEAWFEGGALEGVVVSRPFLPGARPAKNVRERVCAQLSDILPRLCGRCDMVAVSSDDGSAFVYTCKGISGFCLVLFANGELESMLLRHCMRRNEISVNAWWDAYLQPEYQYLRTILQSAGADEWAALIEDGEFDTESAKLSVKLDILTPDADAEQMAINELAKFIKVMHNMSCPASYKIEKTGIEAVGIEGTPAGYKFRRLTRQHR